MKRLPAVVVWVSMALLAASAVSYVYVWRRDVSKRREMREASYRAAVAAYRKDLPIRTTRNKLESYLRAKNVHFFQDREFRWLVDLVKVGEDDVPIYCDTAYVYVSFAFVEAVPHEPLKPDDLDTLRGIDLSRHMTGCM